MIPTVVKSPYGTNPDGTRASAEVLARNEGYLDACLLDSFRRGEAPFASHGLYPRVFRDAEAKERLLGMGAGLAVGALLPRRAVYCDHGVTPGMLEGVAAARRLGQELVFRLLSRPGHDYQDAPVRIA